MLDLPLDIALGRAFLDFSPLDPSSHPRLLLTVLIGLQELPLLLLESGDSLLDILLVLSQLGDRSMTDLRFYPPENEWVADRAGREELPILRLRLRLGLADLLRVLAHYRLGRLLYLLLLLWRDLGS